MADRPDHERAAEPPPHELLIGADDRTGALESAGAAAEAIGTPVTVLVGGWSEPSSPDRAVEGSVVAIDIGSRHLAPAAAGERAAALDRIPARRHVHKIDSTLRGRWADELVARSADGTRPVLVVPALPSLGRVCVDGVVLVDGRPVREGAAGADVVAPPTSSRPAELLAIAGAGDVRTVRDVDQLVEWLERPRGVVVADAATDEAVVALVTACWEHPEVLLAGTSAVALVAARLVSEESRPPRPRVAAPTVRPGELLVVVGSAHPVVAEQLDRLQQRGFCMVTGDGPAGPTHDVDVPTVLTARRRPPGGVSTEMAVRHAHELAATAARWTEVLDPGMLVVIGGDTAAALLGDHPVEVEGLVGPGTPWARHPASRRTIVTRAGGFGGPDALADLLWGTLIR